MTENRTETTVEKLGLAALCLVVLCSAAALLACGAFAWIRITEMASFRADQLVESAMLAAGV